MANPGSSSSTGVIPKSQKAKRKISLPWFRQGSVAQPHPTLTRQHTIDTPSSFQARLLRRQPSQSALANVLEMTWVVSDFTATGPQELSVTKGQQVEVVEVCSAKPDFCLVRMPTRGTDHDSASVPEGMVPLAVLKQPPPPRSSPSRRPAAEHEQIDTVPNDTSGTVNTSSPVNKRRGFSGRKWLPPPLRKLSQGKVDKPQSTASQLKKAGSDKRIKVPSESDMGNKTSVSEGEEDEDRPPLSVKGAKSVPEPINGGPEDVDELPELPPPMKPIQEPILVTPPPGVPDIEENPRKGVSSLTLKSLEGATSADLAEIEQIVKERMEQHSENQERNSLLRDTKSSDAISDYGENHHPELSAQCSSNEATALAFSGDESDKPSEDSSVDSAKKIESLLKKRRYVLKELIDTEEAYVRDLTLIVEGYITTMRNPNCEIVMPEDLRSGKDKMVFGNIEVIYEWHKNIFFEKLRKAIENPIELAQLFKQYERKLHMYVVYCKNKPVSEYIVSEYLDTYFEDLRVKMGHKLQLCDLLIKPVQRIMKYQLMLKDILKYTERAGLVTEVEPLRAAFEIMVIVPKAANDMMDVGRLQGFDGKITAQGKLLHHGLLTCSDVPGSTSAILGKTKDLQVFLFEQNIIFSEIVGKKTQFTSPQYIYKAHIQVNKMILESKEDCFILKSSDPNKPILGFVCQVNAPDLQEQWVSTITNILQTQKDFLKAIQSPIAYQKELTKDTNLSDMWDPSHLRKSVSIPITSTSGSSGESTKSHRKTTQYIHKANTIGIPSERDLSDGAENKGHHSNKTRLTLFEGLKNSLRSKHKSDSAVLEPSTKENEKNDLHRRWSEANHAACESHVIMAPGTQARLVCEWPEMTLGEVVTVIRFDAMQGYLVRTNTQLEEIWLPAHILSNYNRKPWSFRFRKPSRRSIDGSTIQENIIPETPILEFRDKLKDIVVQSGSKVALKCRIKNCNKNVKISWKKIEPNTCIMQNGRFLFGQNDEGVATLNLDNVKISDSGTYSVTIANDFSSIECSSILTVTDLYPPLREPKIQVLSNSSVLLEWENDIYHQFLVEYCKLGSGEWLSPNNNNVINCEMYTFENLIPGETYSFRIIATQNKLVSLPSIAVTLPVADNLRWQQEQFKRRYIELEEIDRGRFSVVRLAKDRGTGVEVALKQVTRRKQAHHITQAEYTLLAGMQHLNIIRSMALFDNAPLPGLDTIVLELVKGPLLFTYISNSEEYSETEVRNYTRQLMSALCWLHKKDIAHLDIKPENVMIDVSNSTPVLKLVDFGDSVNTLKNVILPPACLEFASPELVLGQPIGKHTDYWAAGVFLYVLLSGVSPFLDDSMEETTANILKCDYCFPEDYFTQISNEAKDLVTNLLILVPSNRMNMEDCLNSAWMKGGSPNNHNIPSSRLRTFMQRRHPINVATSPTSPTYFN